MKKLLSCLFFTIFIQAQNDQWKIYDTSNSPLGNRTIFDTNFDQDGNIWIGTWGNGLFKLNENGFENFSPDNSDIPDDEVYNIYINDDGKIWCGTRFGGLGIYDGLDWQVFDENNSSLPFNWVKTIVKDRQDNYWLNTNFGLAKINPEGEWEIYNKWNSILTSNYSWELLVQEDTIWLATIDFGLVKIVGDEPWKIIDTENSNLLENNITALALDNNNRLWYGTRFQGFGYYNGKDFTNFTELSHQFPSDTILDIAIDHKNIAWVGTTVGLVKVENDQMETFLFSNSPVRTNFIAQIDVDDFNNKWIGLNQFGMAVYNEDGIQGSILTVTNEMEADKLIEINLLSNANSKQLEFEIQCATTFKNLQLNLYNINGRLMDSENVDLLSGINRISFSSINYSTGNYFVQLRSNNVQISEQIVIY